MSEQLEQLVETLYPTLVEWRRDFHYYAESGWVEFRTASKVAARLAEWGYEVKVGREVIKDEARMGVPSEAFLQEQLKRALEQGADPDWIPRLAGGFTGVVGILRTGKPGPTVGFRFDMDALDIQESSDPEHIPVAQGFRSTNANMMHACGHDAHTAIGLGLAKTLIALKEQLTGTILVIFQPAEEGVRGAKSMVEAGVLDQVEMFFASHIGTGPKLGEVVCGARGYLATTKLDVTYQGVASHAGGKPEEGKNALLAAAAAALNLHAISRHSEGASRINVGVLQAGSGRNIVPSRATLKIETRGETSEINEYVYNQALQIIRGAAAMYGVQESISIQGEARRCDSSEELIPFIRTQAKKVHGVERVLDHHPAGGSEDATYMMERVQQNGGLASYLIFGTTLAAGHHNERFDIDEQAMKIAIKTLALCAMQAYQLQK
ncbi:amidohydrolase [Brevibacillus fulvus]|uniref:Aminobenzoyl-glutamate utilization protein A n=1 Tax=Brevibacillus fulvus TaxID=1125967 RepID=A0A938Y1D1_9BACL|nr:amidohydrolase [Brevibacillus fulvus]MBM7591551.1 aminobenzoyl-glutamate utilization protein A [Brevibacillus fulvus]